MDYSKQVQDIPDGSLVVFDWDNTLKIYDKSSRSIRCRFHSDILNDLRWKRCELFIISAIAPRKMALETLLFEVKKLGLEHLFTREDSKIEIEKDCYAKKGNIIACGYDKAETFLKLTKDLLHLSENQNIRENVLMSNTVNPLNASCGMNDVVDDADVGDVVDGDVADCNDLEVDGPPSVGTESDCKGTKRHIVFFDDEEVNIINFREIVKDSICHHVV